VQDDPVLVSLEDEHVGLSTGVHQGSDFYEATCAPIELADYCCWKVPERDLVPLDVGGFSQNSVENDSLWGVFLHDEGREPMKQVHADERVKACKERRVLMKCFRTLRKNVDPKAAALSSKKRKR
jgi:hypothetical protein